MHNTNTIRRRHNNKKKLENLLKQTYPGSDTALKVDLAVINKQRRVIDLIDINTPYDFITGFENAHQYNEEHYQQHLSAIKQLHPESLVRLSTIVVGSLGSWDPNNNTVLR